MNNNQQPLQPTTTTTPPAVAVGSQTPQQGYYPPQQGYYPPQQGYPPQQYYQQQPQQGYPPQQYYQPQANTVGAYPPQQGYYPPQQGYYQQPQANNVGAYPPQQQQQGYAYPSYNPYPTYPAPATNAYPPYNQQQPQPGQPQYPPVQQQPQQGQPQYPPVQQYSPIQAPVPVTVPVPEPTSKLSLVARKSLVDNQKNLDKALEKIKNAVGQVWNIEFDLDNILEKMEAYIQKDPGQFFYDTVASGIATCLENTCKEEIAKEALVESVSSNTIQLQINTDKKNSTYWKFVIENNKLVLLFRVPTSNSQEINYFKLPTILPSAGVLSVVARINFKKSQESLDQALQDISKVCSTQWSIDQESIEEMYKSVTDDYTRNNIGDVVKDIVGYCRDNIVKRCKDDMVQEAFIEATTKSKLIFKYLPKQSQSWTWSFVNGDLFINWRSISNVHENSYYNWELLL